MRLEIKVTGELPPVRFITGINPDERMPEAMAVKGHSLITLTPEHTDPLVVDVVSVTTGDNLSGYVIGQMLRALAEDVEAADEMLHPPKVTTAAVGDSR